MTRKVEPVLAADPLVEEAARRAFAGLSSEWFDRGGNAGADAKARRAKLLQSIVDLGFADALPAPGAREHWVDAAVLIRAQARAAVPVDLALLLAAGDSAGCVEYDPDIYVSIERPVPADPAVVAALSLGRCLQLTAAMSASLDLSLQYVQDRKQFGRTLSKFQAIQHGLALAAEEIAAATAITDLALARMVAQGPLETATGALLDAAALVCTRAVDVVYDHCHQVHGAIGFTREYALHRHSLDLLRWREHLLQLRGGELACAERTGGAALAAGSAWRAITSMMRPGAANG